MSKQMLSVVSLLLLFILGIFTACQSSDAEVGTATVTPLSLAEIVSTETPEVAVTAEPTTPVTVTLPTPTLIAPPGLLDSPRTGGVLGESWQLADLRYGEHANYLRVVWELAENRENLPQYRVVEVDNAAHPLPGGADPSWGQARLELVFSAVYVDDYPLTSTLPLEVEESSLVTRLDTYPTADDALLGFAIGLVEPAQYEVYELTDPVRLVIDIFYP